MQDVLIVGGGVIGLSVAYELAQQGLRVTVTDQSAIGREASWAGAGMLPPGDPCGSAATQSLAELSCSLWPKLSDELKSRTGVDNGYLRSGAIQVRTSPEQQPEAEVRAWRGIGVEAELLDRAGIQQYTAAISPEIDAGYHLPTMAQIRNPWHMQALRAACLDLGVTLRPGLPVIGFDRSGDRVSAARTPTERLAAGAFVVTAGAWTSALLESAGAAAEIEPVRGQIILLRVARSPFEHIIESGPRYLVPRSDGRILVGSTEERAGFVKENTAAGLQGLLDFALRLVPNLKEAQFEQAWAGLRPRAVRGRPFIGPVPTHENLFVAAGHFRSGLSNSPGTARIIRELITGNPASIGIEELGLD